MPTTEDKIKALSNKELLELFERMTQLDWYAPDWHWEDEIHPKGFHRRDLTAVRSEVYARMCGPRIYNTEPGGT